MQRYWRINDEVYNVWLHLIVNCSFKVAEQYLERNFEGDYSPATVDVNWGAYCGNIYDKQSQCIGYVLHMKHFNWTIDDQGTLAHEIYHLVERILGDRDIDKADSEAYAYYVGFWTRKIKEALKKTRLSGV